MDFKYQSHSPLSPVLRTPIRHLTGFKGNPSRFKSGSHSAAAVNEGPETSSTISTSDIEAIVMFYLPLVHSISTRLKEVSRLLPRFKVGPVSFKGVSGTRRGKARASFTRVRGSVPLDRPP